MEKTLAYLRTDWAEHELLSKIYRLFPHPQRQVTDYDHAKELLETYFFGYSEGKAFRESIARCVRTIFPSLITIDDNDCRFLEIEQFLNQGDYTNTLSQLLNTDAPHLPQDVLDFTIHAVLNEGLFLCRPTTKSDLDQWINEARMRSNVKKVTDYILDWVDRDLIADITDADVTELLVVHNIIDRPKMPPYSYLECKCTINKCMECGCDNVWSCSSCKRFKDMQRDKFCFDCSARLSDGGKLEPT